MNPPSRPSLPPATTAAKIDRLYQLLPAIYRIRDDEQDEQLRALLAIIEHELLAIEGNIEDLYENWFIETCADWVVPYIGDLLATRDLNVASPRTDGQERRAYVANTLAYRQRKGTTPVLEQLARDITGWGAKAVEALPFLATTQHLDRSPSNGTVDLRASKRPERLGTPFAQGAAYTTALQGLTNNSSRYNPARVNLYLWRLQSYPLEGVTARSIPNPPNSTGYYFSFNPLGYSAPLFNQPQTETEFVQLAEEINLPSALNRETLNNVLNSQPDSPEYLHYFEWQPAFQININGAKKSLEPKYLRIENLDWKSEKWQPPMPSDNFIKSIEAFDIPEPGSENSESRIGAIEAIVDPELGRLLLFAEEEPESVEVSYNYGFSGDIGGGPYDRPSTISVGEASALRNRTSSSSQLIWEIENTKLSETVTAWNRLAQVWQNCDDYTYIPLARIAINGEGEATVLPSIDSTWQPQFQAGILTGLEVVAEVGDLEATVLTGIAIDGNGEPIELPIRESIVLGDYPDRTVWLVISNLPRQSPPQWQITIVPIELEDRYPTDRYIRLVSLKLDANGRIESIDPLVNSFSPGILRGLNVNVENNNGEILVTIVNEQGALGRAVNRYGAIIDFAPQSVPLVKLLTIHDRINNSDALKDRRIIILLIPGTQPELRAIFDLDIGVIRLSGNQTTTQNLRLKIPARKQLHLVAANGDRPHLQGDLFVEGIATPGAVASGELWLDGLLLEGQLVVSPGNLKRLHISHSTLVPHAGGLVVERPQLEVVDEDDSDVALLAMLMYSVTLFLRLIEAGWGKPSLSPQQRIERITDLTWKQMQNALGAIHHVIQQWQHPQPSNPEQPCTDEPPLDFNADNGQLQISIERSICGAIALADSIPNLQIVDSIIDSGIEDGRIGAIAAIGADTEVVNSTILGMTMVRSLEASNSIFGNRVVTLRRQSGCMRFCYVPPSSHTPPRYRCQPDLVLAERVDHTLAPITCLTAHASQLFVSTAGNGVFYCDGYLLWIPLKLGLDSSLVTALVVLTPSTGDPYLLASTWGGKLFQAPIPTLGSGAGTISTQGTKVKGSGTRFLTEVKVGNPIVVDRQVRTVVAIASDLELQIDSPFDRDLPADNPQSFSIDRTQWTLVTTDIQVVSRGTGKISNQQAADDTVTTCLRGYDTQFTTEIAPGDRIVVLNRDLVVREISSDTILELESACADRFIGEPFQIIKTYQNQPLTNISITNLQQANQNSIWATTAGNGVFHSEDGKVWTTGSEGLTNLDIRTIAPSGDRIFVGTRGGGLFWSTDRGNTWQGGDPPDPTIRQSGLIDPDITALAINSCNGRIFAATASSGVFRSVDRGERWESANCNSNHLHITALAIDEPPTRGTITTVYNEVTFSDEDFINSLPNGNYTIVANGQTRILTVVRIAFPMGNRSQADDSPLEQRNQRVILSLNDTFNTDLLAEPFYLIDLYAGTSDGRVLRSTDEGASWRQIGGSLTNTDITTLTFLPIDGKSTLAVGTRLGSVFYLDDSDNWLSFNRGLDRIDAALGVIDRIQPDYTSTDYGQPGYAQLTNTSPVEIYTGAEDGSEMGAFSYLKQPQRSANLQASLTEYLRFGLQINTIYMT